MRKSGTQKFLYQQVKNHVLEHIVSEEWPVGTRIPSENQLVRRLNVSRMTVNRALRELTEDGYLMRIHGAGTFVEERKPLMAFLEVKSIAVEIKERGGNHRSVVHVLQEERANASIAAYMGLGIGEPLFHSVLVHMDNLRPVQLSDRYVNPSVAPDYLSQDFTVITPHAYLSKVAPLQEAEHVVEAILPDKRSQILLHIDRLEPCLLLHRRTWALGQVATKTLLTYPGSRYRIGGRFKAV